ncbi:MAG: Gfo/Idh/MocA family oxidoreductase [Kiritimatiellae bacterium]|nr:Gfo/Idh/MocA family oxidoreductase [Kiritimatiellia bacterium]
MKKTINLSRRQFIGASGAAGMFAVAGCTGFPAITSVKSPNGKLRHMSIGCGNRGWGDILELSTHKNIEMAAFCDVDANYLAQAKKRFPGARFFRDWREMFIAVGDGCDSVTVSAPDHHHIHMASAAMRLGKHVYLQKPMAKTMQETEFLRRTAAENGVVTQMGTQYFAYPSDRQVVAMLRAGTLGPVEKAYFFSTRKGVSRRRRLAPVPAKVPVTLEWNLWLGSAAERPYAEGVYHPLIWRIWRDLGSGWIGDIGCHLVGAVWRGLDLGGAAPVDVRAETITDAEESVKDKVWPTAAHILWHFNGVPATGGRPFEMEWFDGCSDPDALAPANYRTPAEVDELFAKSPFKKRPHEGKAVRCREGWILQPHGVPAAYAVRNDGTEVKVPDAGKAPTHYHEFVDCCLEGKKASTDFEWSTYMREFVITGEIAERCAGRTLKWNAASRRFGDPVADAFLVRSYRKGWEVPGMTRA